MLVTTSSLVLVTASAGWSMRPGSPNSSLYVTQLSKSAGWSSGEGWVVADPKNPNVVTADWTSIPWLSATSTLSGPGPHAMQCGLGRSTDGGRTWTESTLPPFQPDGLPANAGACIDPTLVTDSSGTLYAVSNGGSVVPDAGSREVPPSFCCTFTRSTDGGRTWSAPTRVATFADEVANGASGGPLTWAFDRPYLIIDPQTSTLYASTSDDSHVERVVYSSHDRGTTWSGPYALDPDDQSVWADTLSAAHGVLAVAYSVDPKSSGYETASSPVVRCARVCAVFETSTDGGYTWHRRVLPAPQVVSAASGIGPTAAGLQVAADPSRVGHYAVLLPATASSEQVWITSNDGAAWTRVLTISAAGADTIAKPWIAYGPTGALGVVFRDVHGDGSYDVKAVVSASGGQTFEGPVELSRGTAPADPPPQGTPGDDCACNLFLDAHYLYTTWGDSRGGDLQVWFARLRY